MIVVVKVLGYLGLHVHVKIKPEHALLCIAFSQVYMRSFRDAKLLEL